MVDGFSKRPRYVLKDGSRPICPPISQISSDIRATVIYGYSDKPEYDAFLTVSLLPLTPYPMVKRFLENEIELDSSSLKLVVLDAVSATQDCLVAATFQAVLESFQLGLDSVAVSHRLVRQKSSSDYRIETISTDSNRGKVACIL